MKTIITIECPSPEAAAQLFARLTGAAERVVIDVQPTPLPIVDVKPVRKPRADAGQPRAPYKPRTQEANPAGAGAQAGNPGGAPTGSPAAPAGAASAIASSAPATVVASVTEKGTPAAAGSPPPAPAAEDFPATLDGARKAMAALNATSGKGMDACIQALKGAGVNRISDLPKEKYADFIQLVLAESSAEGIAAAKKAPAAKK